MNMFDKFDNFSIVQHGFGLVWLSSHPVFKKKYQVGSKYLAYVPMVSSLLLVPNFFNSKFSKTKILN
jgi:hypothetical protein